MACGSFLMRNKNFNFTEYSCTKMLCSPTTTTYNYIQKQVHIWLYIHVSNIHSVASLFGTLTKTNAV